MINRQSTHLLWWLVTIILLANFSLLLSLGTGDPKAIKAIDWLDVIGEGGAAVFVFAWMWFVLSGRPAGHVTNKLVSGLGLIFLAMFQDALDEFIHFPSAVLWNTVVQSTLLPVGMVLLTWGLYLLRKEQKVIATQLNGRERILRDHRLVDNITNLSDVRYLYQQLKREVQTSTKEEQVFSLILLDINRFNEINRRFGFAEGDKLLHTLAELILLNIRKTDLVCRFAGDRFAILLPATGEQEATRISSQLRNSIEHLTFYTAMTECVLVTASTGSATCRDGDLAQLMEFAKTRLLKAKERLARPNVAA